MNIRLSIYKQIITTIGGYIVGYPATGIDEFFNKLIENGVKTIPNEKKVLDILGEIFYDIGNDSFSNTALQGEEKPFSSIKAIQNFMNARFSDLSIRTRPLYKDDGNIKTAFWSCDECVSDRVKNLVNPEGKGTGFWSDEAGDKVTLIEI